MPTSVMPTLSVKVTNLFKKVDGDTHNFDCVHSKIIMQESDVTATKSEICYRAGVKSIGLSCICKMETSLKQSSLTISFK